MRSWHWRPWRFFHTPEERLRAAERRAVDLLYYAMLAAFAGLLIVGIARRTSAIEAALDLGALPEGPADVVGEFSLGGLYIRPDLGGGVLQDLELNGDRYVAPVFVCGPGEPRALRLVVSDSNVGTQLISVNSMSFVTPSTKTADVVVEFPGECIVLGDDGDGSVIHSIEWLDSLPDEEPPNVDPRIDVRPERLACSEVDHYTTPDFPELLTSLAVHNVQSQDNAKALTCLHIGEVREGELLDINAAGQVTNNSGTVVGFGHFLAASTSCDMAGFQAYVTKGKGQNPTPTTHHHEIAATRRWLVPRDFDDIYIVHFIYAGLRGGAAPLVVDQGAAHMDVKRCL